MSGKFHLFHLHRAYCVRAIRYPAASTPALAFHANFYGSVCGLKKYRASHARCSLLASHHLCSAADGVPAYRRPVTFSYHPCQSHRPTTSNVYPIRWSRMLIFIFLRFKVMDDERLGDDLAAWACFRLDRLQPGVRMLHLYNSNGVISKGVLLVRIKKTVS